MHLIQIEVSIKILERLKLEYATKIMLSLVYYQVVGYAVKY